MNNYRSDIAYLMSWLGNTAVEEDYKTACETLACYWGLLPWNASYEQCYSSSWNSTVIGTDTYYCADGTLSYYNIPANYCLESRACPNPTWTLTSDLLHCTRPSTTCSETADTVSEFQLIAAIVYGEASTADVFEEQAAIANALVRKRNSYINNSTTPPSLKYPTVNELIKRYPNYSAAYVDKVERYQIALCANLQVEFPQLYEAVTNALDPEGIDYANGGCYWDGKDLQTLGTKHMHYKNGYKFSNTSDDIFSLGDSAPQEQTQRGRTWYYTYESTAGYGGTVFWKLTPEFMYATGAPQCH